MVPRSLLYLTVPSAYPLDLFLPAVSPTGTPGSLEAKVTFVVPSNAPDDLRYYCTVHGNGMGMLYLLLIRIPPIFKLQET